jgi:phenylpropionate dioxygenase-like ring-hydroxylating dioxygenase large terminal subunit
MEAVTPQSNAWDRGGLPVWTYGNTELSELEKEHVFRRNWLCAGHVCEIPNPGDYLSFDAADERAVFIRDSNGEVRAFHNLCRHRGSRIVAEREGHCRSAIVCPFHGWSYNLDGSLRTIAAPRSFPDMDKSKLGLKPVEFEIWHGLIFVRFKGSGAGVAETMAPFEDEIAPYRIEDMEPIGEPDETHLDIDWKAVVDIDNEGYHVAIGHPGLHQLYGSSYYDEISHNGVQRSFGEFEDKAARLWSVRSYLNILPDAEHLPESHRRAWLYYTIFPHNAFGLYPDMFDFYQVLPTGPESCKVRSRSFGLPGADRQLRAARYLNERINNETSREDNQLMIWFREGMRSSAFDDLILSDTEICVRAYHDELRRLMPVMNLTEAPRPGEMEAVNRQLTQAAE